jgi:hypothetical protein
MWMACIGISYTLKLHIICKLISIFIQHSYPTPGNTIIQLNLSVNFGNIIMAQLLHSKYRTARLGGKNETRNMLMYTCIIRMNVNNTSISVAIFWCNLSQSKYETGSSIGYPFRKLTNSCVSICVCVCVCALNTELYINLSSTQTSPQEKKNTHTQSTNVISKERQLCQQYTESDISVNRCRICQWQIHWFQSKPTAYFPAWNNNYFTNRITVSPPHIDDRYRYKWTA